MNTHDRNKNDQEERTFSGRFPVRMPRYLHRQLTQTAREQGVSLNQFVCTAAIMAAGLNVQKDERINDEAFSQIWSDLLG